MTWDSKDIINISAYISMQEFERIITFVLKHGDRRTYRNIDCNNPHYQIKDFDLYLSPEDRQNTFCDIEKSGFNEIVIYHPHQEIQYYHLRMVRNGELNKEDVRQPPGLEENNVYLIGSNYVDIKQQYKKFLNDYYKALQEILQDISHNNL